MTKSQGSLLATTIPDRSTFYILVVWAAEPKALVNLPFWHGVTSVLLMSLIRLVVSERVYWLCQSTALLQAVLLLGMSISLPASSWLSAPATWKRLSFGARKRNSTTFTPKRVVGERDDDLPKSTIYLVMVTLLML